MDVGNWLRSLGLGEYEPAFRDNQIDSEVLPNLTGEDLMELGVGSVGHRRKLLSAIAQLSGRSAELTAVAQGTRVEPPAHDAAERRQLTVMFCDLVGSTALATRLDPRTCARSSRSITSAAPRSSSAAAASSPNTWAMGCWPISAIRRHMNTTPSTR